MSFSMYEFRDTDLMAKLSELGGVSSHDLASEMGLTEEATLAAGSRLAWMRRYGMVVFDQKQKLWALSRSGERVMAAKRRAALHNLIEQMPEGELIEAMAYICSRYRHGEPMVGHMLRREFLFGTSPRSRVWSV